MNTVFILLALLCLLAIQVLACVLCWHMGVRHEFLRNFDQSPQEFYEQPTYQMRSVRLVDTSLKPR